MDALEQALPSEITNLAVRSGNELSIPLHEAKRAVSIASQNSIAVLGIEVFRLLDNGLRVETYSGYEFKFDGDWRNLVRLNNDAGLRCMENNGFGKGYGYVLTATSEDEFRELQTKI
jgi:hypothetical protein